MSTGGKVLATCDKCGHIELDELVVRRCVDTGQVDYRFRCPICSMFAVKPLVPHVFELLMRAGAPLEQWTLPAELRERPGADVPPICADDLIDFHADLDKLPTADARARARGGS
jgi:hypothetical protein